jgi:hypothetical protein
MLLGELRGTLIVVRVGKVFSPSRRHGQLLQLPQQMQVPSFGSAEIGLTGLEPA